MKRFAAALVVLFVAALLAPATLAQEGKLSGSYSSTKKARPDKGKNIKIQQGTTAIEARAATSVVAAEPDIDVVPAAPVVTAEPPPSLAPSDAGAAGEPGAMIDQEYSLLEPSGGGYGSDDVPRLYDDAVLTVVGIVPELRYCPGDYGESAAAEPATATPASTAGGQSSAAAPASPAGAPAAAPASPPAGTRAGEG